MAYRGRPARANGHPILKVIGKTVKKIRHILCCHFLLGTMRRRPGLQDTGSAVPSSSPRSPTTGRKRPRTWQPITERTKCAGIAIGATLLASVGLLGMLAEVAYPVRDGTSTGGNAGPMIRGGGGGKSKAKQVLPRQGRPLIYAVGLVRTMSAIHPEVLKWLAEMNCNHGVGLHILAGSTGSGTNGGGNGDAAGTNNGGSKEGGGLDHYRSRIVDEQSRMPTEDPAEPASDTANAASAASAADGAANANGNAHNDHGKEFVGCAPVHIITEDPSAIYGPNNPSPPTNRVQRIAALRDYQRELLRPLYEESSNAGSGVDIKEGAVVVVIDLDLAALPPPQRVLDVTHKLAEDSSFPYDAICAAGVTAASSSLRDLWYYDTYATVLWPDTYLHPLNRRLIKHHYPGEDPALVRSDDRNGNWTQGDIMRYLQVQGEASEYGVVEARSCFGGLTLYRAAAWFKPTCRYGADVDVRGAGAGRDPAAAATDGDGLMRYASEADGRPCEHVVFHDCLIRARGSGRSGGSRLAILPKLLTLWRKDKKT